MDMFVDKGHLHEMLISGIEYFVVSAWNKDMSFYYESVVDLGYKQSIPEKATLLKISKGSYDKYLRACAAKNRPVYPLPKVHDVEEVSVSFF